MPGRLDVHHVVKRAHGGPDFDLDQLVALCRTWHEQTDAPYAKGRLVVTPLGGGQFSFEVVRRAGKWVAADATAGLPTWANHPASVSR